MRENHALLPLSRPRTASESTDHLNPKQPSQRKTPPPLVPHRSSILKWWPETLGWFISVLIVAAIVVVLHAYNGVVTVRWQSQVPVTLNAFLSLLVTFLYMALMVPIPKCIAQLKWNHYAGGRPRPLADIEIFDEASRTVWGSAVLLATRPKRLLAALGAFLTLAVAAVGPFVQQILDQEVVPRQFDGSPPTVPVMNWTSSYSGDNIMAKPAPSPNDGFDTEDPGANSEMFDDAFYTGLIAPAVRDFPVSPNCAPANCTWEPYWTFVVESECQNITEQFNQSAKTEQWILPNGLAVPFPVGPPTYNITTNYASVAFQDRGHLISDFFITTTGGQNGTYFPIATECILQLRARQVRAQYKNGRWTETQIGPSLSNNTLEARACSPWRRSLAGYYFETPDVSDPTGITYPNITGMDPLYNIWYPGPDPNYSWTSTCNITITTTTTTNNNSHHNPDLLFPAIHLKTPTARLHYLLSLETTSSGAGSYAFSDKVGGILNKLLSLLPTYSLSSGGEYFVQRPQNITLPERLENIAKSLTQALRSSVFSDQILISGEGLRATVVYRVTWNWIIVPGVLVFLTGVLLVLTVWDTGRKGLGKRGDSSLALVAFGCEERVREGLVKAAGGGTGDLGRLGRVAGGMFVRLHGEGHVLRLVEKDVKRVDLGK